MSTRRSGDTSLIANTLTRRRGKIRLMAKGALGTKRPLRSILEPGNHIEATFYFKENRNVHYLKEVSLASAPKRDRDSLPHIAARLATLEILDLVCYPGGGDAAIVDLAVEYIEAPNAEDPLLLFLVFELKLLGVLGAFPDLVSCAVCGVDLGKGCYRAADGASYCSTHVADLNGTQPLGGELRAVVLAVSSTTLAESATLNVPPAVRKELGKLVHETYTFHVQGYSLPKSLKLL